jgi:uncharacterized protein YndB with AHSA1/START domain
VNAYAESNAEGWVLVVVRDLRHPPAAVWAALTEPDQLEAWAPFTAGRDLGATGAATLSMIDGVDGERVDLPVTVLRAEAPTLLEYTWGSDHLRWELAPTDAGTRLTLRHRVGSRDDLSRAAAGWHLCFDVLERLLAGDPVPPVRGQDALRHGWAELQERYAAALAG